MRSGASVLVIIRPGALRDGLQALLSSIPQIRTSELVDGWSSDLRKVKQRSPTLTILASDDGDDQTWEVLAEIKRQYPSTRYLVLVGNTSQHQPGAYTGAIEVVLQGTSPDELVAIIERLITERMVTDGE